jgi:hypothetical protein
MGRAGGHRRQRNPRRFDTSVWVDLKAKLLEVPLVDAAGRCAVPASTLYGSGGFHTSYAARNRLQDQMRAHGSATGNLARPR